MTVKPMTTMYYDENNYIDPTTKPKPIKEVESEIIVRQDLILKISAIILFILK